MLETSARLLRLLTLLQAKPDWSGAELADRLSVTTRTVRRDIDRLRELGYPVTSTTGTAGGYRLGTGASLPPLLLDDDEAVAVAVGLRTAAGGTVSGIEEASLRALAKLEQVLPARLRHQVRTLQSVVVPMAASGPAVDADLITGLAAACRAHEGVAFAYHGKGRRDVEPYRLVHTGSTWYLVAYDLDRDGWRTFRVDRIEGRLSPGRRFSPRPAPAKDFVTYVTDSVAYAPYRYQATVRLHAPYEVVVRHTSPTAGRLERLDEHSCLLHTGSNSLDQLAIYIAVKGFDFDVIEPRELAVHLRTLAERFARAAASP